MNDASERLAKAVEAVDVEFTRFLLALGSDDDEQRSDGITIAGRICRMLREALAAYRAAGEDPWLPADYDEWLRQQSGGPEIIEAWRAYQASRRPLDVPTAPRGE